MQKYLIRLITLIFIFMLSIPIASSTQAASGNQGYAIYRDGVFFGLDWHSGIMVEPTRTNSKPVVHAPGTGSSVKADSWTNYMNGNSFVGVYRPKTSPSSGQRDLFVGLARSLGTQNISYNLAYQIYYNTSTTGTWVAVSDISSMRCDGVVEYVYEWYGFRVYGSNAYWDITKNDYWVRNHHSGNAVTPKIQSGYLTRISTSLP